MKYKIVHAENPNKLANVVNNSIASGYVPYGSPFLFNKILVQAMTTESEEAESSDETVKCSFCSNVITLTSRAFKKINLVTCPECGETNTIKKDKVK